HTTLFRSRMRPLVGTPGIRRPGTRKLQDILTDAKVPRHVRDSLPLVFADGRLAWVPGIAVDADAAARSGPSVHVALANWTGKDWAVTGSGMEGLVLTSGQASSRSRTA